MIKLQNTFNERLNQKNAPVADVGGGNESSGDVGLQHLPMDRRLGIAIFDAARGVETNRRAKWLGWM
jgi:hypothetical protein